MITLEFEDDKALSIAEHMERVALRLRLELAKVCIRKHLHQRGCSHFYTAEIVELLDRTQRKPDQVIHLSLLALAALEQEGYLEEVPCDPFVGGHTNGWKVTRKEVSPC